METPLVSVICLSYNHERFVEDAIRSVLGQTFPRVELIVVDDASTDSSAKVITGLVRENAAIQFIHLKENVGNCKAFNLGLAASHGEFIIDLAGDDMLMPDRIGIGVKAFEERPLCGVHFGDAELIDESGKYLGHHADRFPHRSIPQGRIYTQLIERYFICSPTMMIRRSVLDQLGGYDESLAYEDFDFWIRSAREFEYAYSEEVLLKRRVVKRSMSRNQYQSGSRQLRSTFQVCEKIFRLNRTSEERSALRKRIRYEARRAFLLGEWSLVRDYFRLLVKRK